MEEGRAPFKCRAGSRYLYVDEDSIVRWCSQQRDAFGIPLADFTHDHLREQFHTRKPCADHCTVGCARTCSAYDGWRPQTLAATPAVARADAPEIPADRLRRRGVPVPGA
jgi:hypothetical protein